MKRNLLFIFLVLTIMFPISCSSAKIGPGYRFKNGGAYTGSDPSMSPDGTQIVFGSPRTGLGDIYIMDADGRNRKRLTDNPAYEASPSFTPDGKKIVFVSERDNGYGHIYIMNADGSDQHALTHEEYHDMEPSVSPDGSKIVFSRRVNNTSGSHNYWEIFIMNIDGSGITRLTNNEFQDTKPSFSPDGKKIIYSSLKRGQEYLIIINVDGSKTVEFLKEKDVESGVFLPDGRNIIFLSYKEVKVGNDIHYEPGVYITSVEKINPIRLLVSQTDLRSPKISYDGKKIMLLGKVDNYGNGQIMMMNIDGSDVKVIADN